MNKETVIALAEEAGLEPRLWNHTDAFERFAALVAEHEREACAKIVDDWYNSLASEPEMAYIAAEIRSRT